MNQTDSDRFAALLDQLEGRTDNAIDPTPTAAPAQQDEIAWLQSFLALSQEVILAVPPARVRAQLRHRFRQRSDHQKKQQSPGFLQRLLATLTFDSQTQLAVAGVRSAAASLDRTLVYNTAVADVTHDIQPQPNETYQMLGQVFPLESDDLDLFSVQLLQDEQEVHITTTDDLGEFAIEGLTTAAYDLVITGHTFELLITSLELSV